MKVQHQVEIPPLPDTTILMVEVGSTAHGTGLDGYEDHDQLAVVVETPEQVLGLDEDGYRSRMDRTQPEGVRSGLGDIDRTLHGLRKFLRLATSGNPSILMALWAPVEHATTEGYELRELSHAFVGRHVIPRYRGYMQSQALRLLGLKAGVTADGAEPNVPSSSPNTATTRSTRCTARGSASDASSC